MLLVHQFILEILFLLVVYVDTFFGSRTFFCWMFLFLNRNTILRITNLRILLSDAANYRLSANLGQLPHYFRLFIAIGFAEIFSVFFSSYKWVNKSAYCNHHPEANNVFLLSFRSIMYLWSISSGFYTAVSAISFN